MINYIKNKISRFRIKKSFKEYEYEIKQFYINGTGFIDYAQWLHPFEQPKIISADDILFYKNLASEGSFMIDIGAHTGDTTLPMALATGKDGLVLAIEPNKYVYKILEKNAILNPNCTNIKTLCAASVMTDGECVFHYSDASFCNGGYLSKIKKKHHHNYKLTVQGINLQDYLFRNYRDDLPKLKLIKIDAEGYDKEILKTIPEILKTYKPVLLVECYKRLNDEERNDLFEVIDMYGYDLFLLGSYQSTKELTRINKHNMNDKKHFDILAIPTK